MLPAQTPDVGQASTSASGGGQSSQPEASLARALPTMPPADLPHDITTTGDKVGR